MRVSLMHCFVVLKMFVALFQNVVIVGCCIFWGVFCLCLFICFGFKLLLVSYSVVFRLLEQTYILCIHVGLCF